jgi:hypothetical protein
VSKDKSEFYYSATGANNLCSYCKECQKQQARDWHKANFKYDKNRERKKKYGITSEQWEELFEKQGRVCAICKSANPKTKQGWHTDHKGEIIRGILCRACNTNLGIYERYRDNPNIHMYLNRL